VILRFLMIARAPAAGGFGEVGPEATTSSRSPMTSERTRLMIELWWKPQFPTLDPVQRLRITLTSSMVAPEAKADNVNACRSSRITPGTGAVASEDAAGDEADQQIVFLPCATNRRAARPAAMLLSSGIGCPAS